MKEPTMPKEDEKTTEAPNPAHPERRDGEPVVEQAREQILNGLLENGVVSSSEADALKPGSLNEVMVRFAGDLAKLTEATEDQKRKIRRVLGLGMNPGDPLPQPERRTKETDELISEMHTYLKAFQAEIPAVVGMVLCGSRMDENKLPDPKSDVDAVLILKPGTETDPRTPEGEKTLFALRGFSDSHNSESGFPVEIDEIYAADKFIEAMTSSEENSRMIWGWNPDALAYIGDEVEDMNEEDVGSFLSLELKSDKAEDLRCQMTKRAAEKIKAEKP